VSIFEIFREFFKNWDWFTHNITFKHLIIYINITFNDRLIYICLIFPFLLKLSPIRFTHKQFLFRRFRFCCEKSVFDRICLVILVGYSRNRTNIYLRDKVLDEKREVSNRFTVNARCTMSIDHAIIGETQVGLFSQKSCVLTHKVLFMARNDGRRISTSALEEEWMTRNVSVVYPHPTRNCSNDFRLGLLLRHNSTSPRINNN